MIEGESGGRTRRRVPRRRWLGLLLLLYGAIVLFGTLWPFNFTLKAVSGEALRTRRIELVPFTVICPKHGFFCPWDWGTNLPLLAPVGALIVLLSNPVAGMARRVGKATVICFAISVCVETAQLFVPARFPSTTDVIQNTLGAFLAAWFVAWLTRGRSQRSVEKEH